MSRWTAFNEPDHTGEQFAAMKQALLHVVDQMAWPLNRVSVWVDYCSIPQRCRGMQTLAIKSLFASPSPAMRRR